MKLFLDSGNKSLAFEINSGNDKKETTLGDVGVSSILLGGLNHAMGFMNPAFTLFFVGGGFATMVFHHINSRENKYDKLWKGLGFKDKNLAPRLRQKKKTSYGMALRFSIPIGKSTEDFQSKSSAIRQYLDKDSRCRRLNIKYAPGGNMLFEIYEKELGSDYKFEAIETEGVLELVIGYTYGDKLITVDLSDGMPHMLIAGETGSGKSTILRQILTTLILTKDPNELELHLIDLKNGAEFSMFKDADIVKSFCKDNKQTEEVLYTLSGEVTKRYDLFEKHECVDIKEYNKKFKNKKMKYKLIVIDEFADLQSESDSLRILQTLGQKARACGIHLLLSTQRPSAKIIDGDIKANIPVVLGLKTMNSVNSRIIIDENGLENLNGKGNGMLKYKGMKEIQGMNIDPEQARLLVKNMKKPPKNSEKVRDFSIKQGKFIKKESKNDKNKAKSNPFDNKTLKNLEGDR